MRALVSIYIDSVEAMSDKKCRTSLQSKIASMRLK